VQNKGTEILFEEIIEDNFQNLDKGMDIQVQEEISTHNSYDYVMLWLKLWEYITHTEYWEFQVTLKGKPIRIIANSSAENLKPGEHGLMYFNSWNKITTNTD
jgi:hypothetical protein